jgi:hypothetical protein
MNCRVLFRRLVVSLGSSYFLLVAAPVLAEVRAKSPAKRGSTTQPPSSQHPADALHWGQPWLYEPLNASNTSFVQSGSHASLLFDAARLDLPETSPCYCAEQTLQFSLPQSIEGPIPSSPSLHGYQLRLQGDVWKDADTRVVITIQVNEKTYQHIYPYGRIRRAEAGPIDLRSLTRAVVKPVPNIPGNQPLPPLNVTVTLQITKRTANATASAFVDSIDIAAQFNETSAR